ncbi:hypothetical protein [Haliangium ochraceum]|uniref:MotA/TolQ/ExbB proton channel domain-containing protein n=1 Tax=Haliangium ochraceum (strain DSM 14365 / JCM 11303 / SMP-2) TaxID=502025 RepID=D0LY06_HALO1|nr:hypothetical protein [Haliangium ochraceum]ACY14361.1 hypothetical protein Hoch_1813 [Haliangium ochraceum DSM 14365]
MLAILDSGIFTALYCALIAVMLAAGWRHLRSERNHLAALNGYILVKYRLGHSAPLDKVARDVVEDITRVERAESAARRLMHLDALWKRAVRLEGSVDFWSDLLQKLGLLGTVLGLGFALALGDGGAQDLLAPLGMAVWTTVAGLLGSVAISWKFGRDVDVEVDTHEENLKEWHNALLGERGDDVLAQPAALGSGAEMAKA